VEHHSGDFQVVVRDIRQLSQQENDALTLLWLLEGSVELRDGETGRYLQADELAIVNRHRRWSLHSKTANVVMALSLNAGWLTRLDGDFFASAYQSSSETRDAEDTLRYLMRQLLVLGLVNPQAHYRLEANRWLSEIALLLASRFSRPLTAQAPRGAERWSQRINRVVARIDANYQRRLSLQEIAAAEFVSEAWLSRLFRKEVGVSFMQYITGLRLRKAAEQLTTTRQSIQQIAQQQGFASSRVMSDLFKREHGLTPRQFRQQHPQTAVESPRPHLQQTERWQPVSIDRLYARLNAPQTYGLDSPPLRLSPQQTRHLDVRELPARAAPLRHTRMVITVRELDDLLREDVRRELEQLHDALPIFAIDIHDPFLSSRLFGTGWDDPQMAGYACWYNLQRIFSWLATQGWAVILHTGLTTRGDLLQRFSLCPLTIFRRQPSPAGTSSGTGPLRPATRPASTPGGNKRRSCRGYRRSRRWGSGTVFLNRWRTIPFCVHRCWSRRIFWPARPMLMNCWISRRWIARNWPPAKTIRYTNCANFIARCASGSSCCRFGCSRGIPSPAIPAIPTAVSFAARC
jgi:AraC-like DNA-binding protein